MTVFRLTNIQQLHLCGKSLPRQTAPTEDYLSEEMNELYQQSLAAAPVLGDRPLISIIAMRADPLPEGVSQEQWDALFRQKVDQKRAYRDLSTNSKVVEDSITRHSVHLDDPDIVVCAIRGVLNAAQRHTQLLS